MNPTDLITHEPLSHNDAYIYILEFSGTLGDPSNPKGQAKFYVGKTFDVAARLEEHRAGQGAHITRAAVQQGLTLNVVAVFKGAGTIERQIKNQANTPRLVARLRAGDCPKSLPQPVYVN